MKTKSLTDETVDIWTTRLGVFPVSLRPNQDDLRFVLQNGSQGSFCLDLSQNEPLDPRRGAWSSNVGHYVQEVGAELRVARWDRPAAFAESWATKSVLPKLEEFHAYLEQSSPPSEASVIAHGIRVFRQLRSSLPPNTDRTDALHAFLLLLAEASSDVTLRTVDDLADRGLDSRAPEFADRIKTHDWESLCSELRQGNAVKNLSLDVELLLRHAAGSLFQEAHREAFFPGGQQLTLGTLAPLPASVSTRPAGVGLHFTPPMVARSLVQEALAEFESVGKEQITVFDPACGSGEFLLEALRQLAMKGFAGRIRVVGWDISPAAIAMARFVLRAEERSLPGRSIQTALLATDSLDPASRWPEDVDIVLMNPPFISWEDMGSAQRDRMRAVLGPDLLTKRPDAAFAFLLKASEALNKDGVLGTIVPASLLGSDSAAPLRQHLQTSVRPMLVGRLGSQTLFPGALVDAGLLLLTRSSPHARKPVALWADHQPSSVGRALRALRRSLLQGRERSLPLETRNYSVYFSDVPVSLKASWAPRPFRAWKLLRAVSNTATRVGDIFHARQGIRTGLNKVFVLNEEAFRALPLAERKYFRPAVVNGSIRDGVLDRRFFVFYPYGERSIERESGLLKALPEYTRVYLDPDRKKLKDRARITADRWWVLSEARETWLPDSHAKLLSTYFGDEGSFAWDPGGEFAVVQGFAWLPGPRNFTDKVGLAYLALLNSPVFGVLLSASSNSVAGGQWDLSPRFVRSIPLPDFTSSRFDVGLLREIAALGKDVTLGKLTERRQEIEDVARQAYGIGQD